MPPFSVPNSYPKGATRDRDEREYGGSPYRESRSVVPCPRRCADQWWCGVSGKQLSRLQRRSQPNAATPKFPRITTKLWAEAPKVVRQYGRRSSAVALLSLGFRFSRRDACFSSRAREGREEEKVAETPELYPLALATPTLISPATREIVTTAWPLVRDTRPDTSSPFSSGTVRVASARGTGARVTDGQGSYVGVASSGWSAHALGRSGPI